jgi:hypothetical protein
VIHRFSGALGPSMTSSRVPSGACGAAARP